MGIKINKTINQGKISKIRSYLSSKPTLFTSQLPGKRGDFYWL